LRPSELDNLGLRETLEEAISALQAQHPQLRFRLETRGELDRLGESLNINAFRIVQECLTNVLRHAGASRADVLLTHAADDRGERLEIEVRDDGRGMSVAGVEAAARFGILGMRERVESLRGSFVLESEPGRGVCVKVNLPVGARAGAEQGIGA
jgi:signal transduction histidine kinase